MSQSPRPWTWRPGGRHTLDNNLGAFVDAEGNEVCSFGDNTQYYPTEGSEPSAEDIKLILEAVNSK